MSTPLNDGHYFATAMEILGESGPEGLTIAALCGRLRVTKGSFYHHFGGLPQFVTRFLAWWVDQSVELVREMEAEQDARRRIEMGGDYALRFHHRAEAAIRAWGRSNPEVAAAVRTVDGVREDYLVWAFREAGLRPSDAEFFARLSVDVLVARQTREEDVDLGELSAAFLRIRDIVFDARDGALSSGPRPRRPSAPGRPRRSG